MEMTTQREAELLTANAALELEVVRLRNALETFIAEHEECEDSDGWMAQTCSMEALHVADEAMPTPSDTTALEAMIAKVSKVMRERCRVELKRLDYWYSADAIRALPNVTLEELL